jgi:hypothetical protein
MVNSDTLESLPQCCFQYFDTKTGHERSVKFRRAAAKSHQQRKEDDKELICNLTTLFGPLAEQSTRISTFYANHGCEFGCECQNITETEYLNSLFAFSICSGPEFWINAGKFHPDDFKNGDIFASCT